MTDKEITGINYWRRRRGLSVQALAKMTGIHVSKIRDLEQGRAKHQPSLNDYNRLAKALGVTIDDLIETHRESELEGRGNFSSYNSRTDDLNNCVAVYRRQKGLTYVQLAARWGAASLECGRKACSRAKPSPKHVKALAKYEGITEEEFCRKYSGMAA